MLNKALETIDLISEKTAKAFSYLIIVIVLLQAGESIMRYVFGQPTIWSWELAMLLYGVHFIMGAGWVLKEEGHVRTDVIFQKLSPKKQALLELILYPCLFFVFVSVMLWKTTTNAMYSISVREATFTQWAPPFYPIKAIIAIAVLILLLQGIAKWIRCLIFLRKGERI